VMFRRLLMLKQPALMLQCRASVCILRNPHQSLQPRAFGDIEGPRALAVLSVVGIHCGVGGCTEALSAQTFSFISGSHNRPANRGISSHWSDRSFSVRREASATFATAAFMVTAVVLVFGAPVLSPLEQLVHEPNV
jgi:hypothetical protein